VTRVAADAPFLAVAHGRKPARRPLWIMRQAGRYLPEYREMRSRHGFLELCNTPAAAAEVTLQPVRRYGMDAAILFTDLLIPVPPMGIGLRYQPEPVSRRSAFPIPSATCSRCSPRCAWCARSCLRKWR
jgi:uroporphyrinogen decarboxylase